MIKIYYIPGPGRPPKFKQYPPCTWCALKEKPLLYVLPTHHGKKEFCSQTCLTKYHKVYGRGACVHCDNAIGASPVRLEQADGPTKDFCSSICLNKHQKKELLSEQKKCK